jgi:soluble lytic murein transglycosylase
MARPWADGAGAERRIREVWRSEELSERLETEVFETFHDLLTREDHRARMDKRIGAKDFSGASRAAQRLGSDELSIVKACVAAMANETKALDRFDAVETRLGRTWATRYAVFIGCCSTIGWKTLPD